MRIVHLNTELTWRGGESQVFNLMRGLRSRGHDVEAVGLPGGALAKRCREVSLPVHELRMRSDADVPAAARLAAYLRRKPCDILHAQTARAHAIGLWAGMLGATGKLVVSRRLDFPIGRSPLNLWKYRSRGVSAYIAVAGVIRDILVQAGVPPERVTIIHSSIDLARFSGGGSHGAEVRSELGIPAAAPVIGNVAALAWHKGQTDLIAAMPSILRSRPDVRLVVVGGGDEREALVRQTEALGLGGRVVFTGVRTDVPRLLAAFDVFCMSSHLEGLCNSVLEAFAMKVPVVATRAGGLPEIVEHERTGLLVPARDPEALAAGILRMLADPALAARTREEGHRLVHARFGVDYMVDRTAELYARLTGLSAIPR